MSGRLDGKVAVVTGAGSGIGRSIAEMFHREGASVVVADISGQEKLTVEALGDRATAVRVDMSNRAEVQGMVDTAVETFGALHVLVNCAGTPGIAAPLIDYPEDVLERVIGVNLKGPFYAIQAAVPAMIAAGGGSIINISSAQALAAFPGTSAYAASKGAILALNRVVAAEYAGAGVRANVICPGLIDTPMMRGFEEAAPPGGLAPVIAATPLGRLGRPEEIASMALYLASDEASYVTGAIVSVDGGYTAM